MITSSLNTAACGLLNFQGGRTPFPGFVCLRRDFGLRRRGPASSFLEKRYILHTSSVRPGILELKLIILLTFNYHYFFGIFSFYGFSNSQMYLLPKCYSKLKKQIIIPSSFNTNIFLASCTSIC